MNPHQHEPAQDRCREELLVRCIREVLHCQSESRVGHAGNRDASFDVTHGEGVDVTVPDAIDHAEPADLASAQLE